MNVKIISIKLNFNFFLQKIFYFQDSNTKSTETIIIKYDNLSSDKNKFFTDTIKIGKPSNIVIDLEYEKKLITKDFITNISLKNTNEKLQNDEEEPDIRFIYRESNKVLRRNDAFGNEILKGGKIHKVTFIDTIPNKNKKKKIEPYHFIKVQSYKKYNIDVSKKSNRFNCEECKCGVF